MKGKQWLLARERGRRPENTPDLNHRRVISERFRKGPAPSGGDATP